MSDKSKIYGYIKRTINPYGKPFKGTAYDLGVKIMDFIENMDGEKENGWIPVTERMPKEHNSIFAKFKGTNNWSKSMFERTSYKVIVTVKYTDGTILTETAHTKDGKWRLTHPTFNSTVIAWKSLPEPYKEGES